MTLNDHKFGHSPNCLTVLEEWIVLDHTFLCFFLDEVVMKIFVYLLITNPSLYQKIVNLFEPDMKTYIV